MTKFLYLFWAQLRARIWILIPAILLGALPLFFFEKGYWVKFFNQFYPYGLADVFYWITQLGLGWFFVFFIVYFAYKKNWLLASSLTLAGLLNMVIVQVAKRHIFLKYYRPKVFFGSEFESFFHLEGFRYHAVKSFPSGHTATAFALYGLLAFYFSSKEKSKLAASCWIFALLIGLSRVILMQHFYRDIYAGALIGFFVALFAWSFAQTYFVRKSA